MSQSVEERPVALSVWDPVGTKLEDLTRNGAVACLLEDPHGRIVCHAMGAGAPSAVIGSVLSRSSADLHRVATGLRTTGRLTGGPLLAGDVEGWDGAVTIAPLAGAGHLWVFADDPVQPATAALIASDLSGLLHRMQGFATDPGLHDRLHGIGPNVAAVDSWVAVLRQPDRGGWEPLAVHRAVSAALAGTSGLEVTVTHTHAFVLLRDPSAADRIDTALRRVCETTQLALVGAIAPATRGLDRARADAERALAALATPGKCTTVDEARSHETLHRVLEAVRGLPALVSDPLEDLLAAGEPLITSFRTWLDAQGDIAVASTRLGVHANTLRYRIKRAVSLVPADLDDPVARLEIHLRVLSLG